MTDLVEGLADLLRRQAMSRGSVNSTDVPYRVDAQAVLDWLFTCHTCGGDGLVQGCDPDSGVPTGVCCEECDGEGFPPGPPAWLTTMLERIGVVAESGGGELRVLVERELQNYPDNWTPLYRWKGRN